MARTHPPGTAPAKRSNTPRTAKMFPTFGETALQISLRFQIPRIMHPHPRAVPVGPGLCHELSFSIAFMKTINENWIRIAIHILVLNSSRNRTRKETAVIDSGVSPSSTFGSLFVDEE